MKVLIIGSESIHVSNYCETIMPLVDELILLTEQDFKVSVAEKNYSLNLRTYNPLKFVNQIFKLKKILKIENPTIVHAHQINRLSIFVAYILNAKIPFIVTAWGSDVLIEPNKNFIAKKLVQYVLSKAKIITADASSMIHAIKKLVPQKNESEIVGLQYGINPVEPTVKENIIFSNRIHKPLYNIDKIIKYFNEFHKMHNNWTLHIGAIGTETENLKKLVLQLKLQQSVFFHGWLNSDENKNFYAKSKIYISIPSSDGTSVSLLEAMSADCIPVVADIDVSHEWIKNGQNGIIDDANSNPFEKALNIDEQKCFIINQQLIKERALKETTRKIFLELYQKAIASKL